MTVITGPDQAREPGYLHGRIIDFICLGGGSLPIFCVLALLPPAEYRAYVLVSAVYLSHVINNPHFINSYQIFYSGFAAKIAPDRPLRVRYLIAGILAPLMMVLFFAYAVLTSDPGLLGKSVNAMFFLVGWHYAKQGYGILIVESVLKRKFLSDVEKKVLRYNALAIWLVSWLESNRVIETFEFSGIQYVTLGLPDWIFWGALAVACITTSAMITLMGARAMRGDLPINGLFAYLSASYAWLILIKINVLLVIIVPLFHSLQYLAVVWRYQLNKEESQNEGQVKMFSGLLTVRRSKMMMMRFVWIGFCFGVFVFWAIPVGLDWVVEYPEEVFGASLFYFIFLIFINVHHYFLDNVMWRKENKDVAQNLFH